LKVSARDAVLQSLSLALILTHARTLPK